MEATEVKRRDYPPGPNGLAWSCEDAIAELEAMRDTVPRSERKAINRRLHTCRFLLKWCKSRAGYVPDMVKPERGSFQQP